MKIIRRRQFRYLLATYIVLILVMFILPNYSSENYSLLKNTTSHLGAQNTQNAWVMNITFVLLGAACIIEAWINLQPYWFQKVFLTIFGAGLIMIAIYQHAPITEGIPYSVSEDNMHSFFATVVGFSFTSFAISAVFIEQSKIRRMLALLIGIISIVLSVLMFSMTNYMGLWQRLLFIISFAWLLFFMEGQKDD